MRGLYPGSSWCDQGFTCRVRISISWARPGFYAVAVVGPVPASRLSSFDQGFASFISDCARVFLKAREAGLNQDSDLTQACFRLCEGTRRL